MKNLTRQFKAVDLDTEEIVRTLNFEELMNEGCTQQQVEDLNNFTIYGIIDTYNEVEYKRIDSFFKDLV